MLLSSEQCVIYYQGSLATLVVTTRVFSLLAWFSILLPEFEIYYQGLKTPNHTLVQSELRRAESSGLLLYALFAGLRVNFADPTTVTCRFLVTVQSPGTSAQSGGRVLDYFGVDNLVYKDALCPAVEGGDWMASHWGTKEPLLC